MVFLGTVESSRVVGTPKANDDARAGKLRSPYGLPAFPRAASVAAGEGPARCDMPRDAPGYALKEDCEVQNRSGVTL